MKKLLFSTLTAATLLGCGAEPDDARGAGEEMQQAATASDFFVTGRIRKRVSSTDTSKLAVSGVRVWTSAVVNGATVVYETLSDSNGYYQLKLPKGASYTVRAARTSTTLSPSSFTIANTQTSDLARDVNCTAGCVPTLANGQVVRPDKSLAIVHPSVVESPLAANANANAKWSFRYLMEQMKPADMNTNQFIDEWLDELDAGAPPNADFPYGVPPRSTFGIRNQWPTDANGWPEASQAPFRLLGIFNRVDLHDFESGELRFVFGTLPTRPGTARQTVIFEYRLPRDSSRPDRSYWVRRFHELNAFTSFDAAYLNKLAEITDGVVTRTQGGRALNSSSLAQLRLNGDETGAPWSFQEFKLKPKDGSAAPGFLRLADVAQTPDPSHNDSSLARHRTLADWLVQNRAQVLAGKVVMPGGSAFDPLPNNFTGGISHSAQVGGVSGFDWSFSTLTNADGTPYVDEALRQAFAMQTCNGCHVRENEAASVAAPSLNTFFHVAPLPEVTTTDGTNRLSDFVKIVELPRRQQFMAVSLKCLEAGSTYRCPPGAEAIGHR